MKHRKYEYISNSKDMTIKVEKMDNSAKGVSVAAYYGDKLAIFAPYKELILTEDKAPPLRPAAFHVPCSSFHVWNFGFGIWDFQFDASIDVGLITDKNKAANGAFKQRRTP